MSNNFNFTESGYTPTNDFEFDPPTTSYAILAGTSNEYVAVWADPKASINSGMFYAATTGSGAAFSAVSSDDNTLRDSYTIVEEGLWEETLEQEDVVDINVH